MKIVPQQVTLIDYMGTDLSVVNSARVSFDKESTWDSCTVGTPECFGQLERLHEKDVRLISYLAKHKHFTPFTHCTVTFRIKCPIFVARQLHKHQVGFTVNEISRRYVDSEPEFYFPDSWRVKAENVKQGSGGNLDEEDEKRCYGFLEDNTKDTLCHYNTLLDLGVCAEQARMVLPFNTMTEFYMTGSLFGWARMCNLRLDSHAQKEIRDVASLISLEMAELYPVSWEALTNGI